MVKNDNPFITDEQAEKNKAYELMNDDDKLIYCESELKEALKSENYPVIRNLEREIKKLSNDEDEEQEDEGLDTTTRKRLLVFNRNFSFDTNNKDDDELFEIERDDWKTKITNEFIAMYDDGNGMVDWLMFKFHDKDKPSIDEKVRAKQTINEDGYVELHVHGVVKYKEGKTQSAVSKHFLNGNQRSENCKFVDNRLGGVRSACLYLTHHTQGAYNEEKTLYDFEDVAQYGARYKDLIKTAGDSKRKKEDIEADLDNLFDRIFDEEIRIEEARREFKDKHGAYQSVQNSGKFDIAWNNHLESLNTKYTLMSQRGEFSRTTSYIQGDSRTGKSVLGEQLNVAMFGELNSFSIAGGGSDDITFDLVDGYKGETGAVISDVDPKKLSASSLKQLLEEGSFTLMESRNTVKGFYATKLYFANALPLFDYVSQVIAIAVYGKNSYTNYLYNTKENMSEMKQILRRYRNNYVYGLDENGKSVLHIYQLKNELLHSDEIYNEFMNDGKDRIDESILEYYYDYLGNLKYDSVYEKYESKSKNQINFHAERRRLAKEIIKVIDGKTKIQGFTQAKDIVQVDEIEVENEVINNNNLQNNNENSDRFNELFS